MLSEDGERFLPWMADPVINYEHLHRYRAARDLADGRRVLDLASGEGYGSALLAAAASSVVGLDLDPLAVAHAAATYRGPGLAFVQGSITETPFRAAQFDLVVCFEALEHVAEHDRLCGEAARVLKPGGWFVVSTPNRAVYSEAAGYRNPFHVKELDLDEFQALLRRHFAHARVFGQHIYPVSSIFGLGDVPGGPGREYVAAREPGGARYAFTSPGRKAPRYLIGIASSAELPADSGLASFLVDASEQLFEQQRRSEGAVVELTRHLEGRERQVRDLEGRLVEAQDALGREVTARRETADRASELERHLLARAAQAEELDEMLRERGRHVQELADTGEALRATIAGMEATFAWRVHRKVVAALARIRGLRKRGG